MKIEVNKEQFLNLLEDSPVFRHMVFDLLSEKIMGNVLEYYAAELRARFPRGATDEKVPAIKWLREEVKKNNHTDAFVAAGYETYTPFEFNGPHINRILCLAAAKKFVEAIYPSTH